MFNSTFGAGGVIVSGSAMQPAQSGALYWDSNQRAMLIVDGCGNKTSVYPQMQSISLEPRITTVIEWASQKMIEEAELKTLCDQHPGLKDVKEKFDVMLALVRKSQ